MARLVQFLRLVDMQVLELLRRLVKTSMKHLLEFMRASSSVVGDEVVSVHKSSLSFSLKILL